MFSKRIIVAFLIIAAVVSVITMTGCECEHEVKNWTTVTRASSFAPGVKEGRCSKCDTKIEETIPKTNADHGEKLTDYEMQKIAKEYVEDQFVTTYGGYKITKYNFGSITSGSDNLRTDPYQIYRHYIVYGTYSYKGKDKYGQTVEGTNTFEYPVKVYQWSKNPDDFREVCND